MLLFGCQRIENKLPHLFRVFGCGSIDRFPVPFRETHHGAAGIIGTGLSCDESPLLHAAGLVGQMAAFPADLRSEIPRPQDMPSPYEFVDMSLIFWTFPSSWV